MCVCSLLSDFSVYGIHVFVRYCLNTLLLSDDFKRLPRTQTFENNVGKGENTGYQHFLLFPLCFLLNQREI